MFYGSSVKQVSVGDDHGFVHDALFSKVGADDINDLLIKKRFTAKPMQMNLFAAAMRCNICRCFVGGFVAHGDAGAPQLVAVKAPGVAVRCGKNGIACNMLRFLPHRAADKPYLVGIFHVVHLLRYTEPAVPQFGQVVRRGIFFRREQQQRPRQGVEHQHPALDRLRNNICHPAQTVLCQFRLAKDLDCIARRRQNGFHCSAPPIDSSRGKLQVRLPVPCCSPADTAARCCPAGLPAPAFLPAPPDLPDGGSADRAWAALPFLKCA